MQRSRGRGFTLGELVLSVAILAGMFLLTQVQLHTGVQNAGAHGLALEVAGQLRACRQRALVSQSPVMAGFPSAGGTLSCFQALYCAQGQARPAVYQTQDFSHDYPQQVLFLGQWPLAAGYGANSSASVPLVQTTSVATSTWLPALGAAPPPTSQDPCLIFTPQGSIISNGLVNFQGAYHLVVAAGAVSAGGSAAGNGMRCDNLVRAGEAWTVACSSSGSISLEAGIAGQDGSISTHDNVAVPATAAPVEIKSAQLAAPQITSVVVGPQLQVASEATCLASAGNVVTLSVTATCSDASDLFVSWTSDAGGTFSQAPTYKMNWDPIAQSWSNNCAWSPPATFASTATLHCAVRNAQGTVAVSNLPASTLSPTVAPNINPGKVLFLDTSNNLCQICADGSGFRHVPLPPNVDPTTATLTTDGHTLFCSNNNGSIVRADLNGNTIQNFGNFGLTGTVFPKLSPSLNRICITQPDQANSAYHFYVFDCAGNKLSQHDLPYDFGNNKEVIYYPCWSADGNQFVFGVYQVGPVIWDSYMCQATRDEPVIPSIYHSGVNSLLIPEGTAVYAPYRGKQMVLLMLTDVSAVGNVGAHSLIGTLEALDPSITNQNNPNPNVQSLTPVASFASQGLQGIHPTLVTNNSVVNTLAMLMSPSAAQFGAPFNLFTFDYNLNNALARQVSSVPAYWSVSTGITSGPP